MAHTNIYTFPVWQIGIILIDLQKIIIAITYPFCSKVTFKIIRCQYFWYQELTNWTQTYYDTLPIRCNSIVWPIYLWFKTELSQLLLCWLLSLLIWWSKGEEVRYCTFENILASHHLEIADLRYVRSQSSQAATVEYHRPGSLQTTETYLSQFWRLPARWGSMEGPLPGCRPLTSPCILAW